MTLETQGHGFGRGRVIPNRARLAGMDEMEALAAEGGVTALQPGGIALEQ
jgi:hypothetical protein